jgi:hypothetical protein
MNSALTDFPDRLSPMVVKELRQGLRMRLFGGVFLTLHILLILITLMGGASSNDRSISGLFDGLITVILCVVFPLRGFAALAQEMKAGTLDMLVLTRLSAWRIVLGKWSSTALLSLLVALSVLPYVVSRYVFGGIDLMDEVGALFLKWLGGLVIAAAIVCVSTIRQQWLRGLIVGLPLLGLGFFGFIFAIFSRFGPGGSTTTFGGVSVSTFMTSSLWFITPLAAWAVFGLLGVATTRIAPPSSLFPVFKRLVHFIVVAVVAVFSWQMAVPLLYLVMADVMLEQNSDVPSVHAAFYRRGWPGRLAGWFFAPGWASGFFFALLLTSIAGVAAWQAGGLDSVAQVWLTACSMWLVACLMQLVAGRGTGDRLALFVITLLCVQVLTALVSSMMIAASVSGRAPWAGTLLPTLVISASSISSGGKTDILTAGLAISSLWPLLHFLQALLARRRLRAVFQEASEIQHQKSKT